MIDSIRLASCSSSLLYPSLMWTTFFFVCLLQTSVFVLFILQRNTEVAEEKDWIFYSTVCLRFNASWQSNSSIYV